MSPTATTAMRSPGRKRSAPPARYSATAAHGWPGLPKQVRPCGVVAGRYVAPPKLRPAREPRPHATVPPGSCHRLVARLFGAARSRPVDGGDPRRRRGGVQPLHAPQGADRPGCAVAACRWCRWPAHMDLRRQPAAAVQAICDSLGPDQIDALLRKWLKILPHPFTPGDEAAGYRYELSILQAEFSLTQMLDRPVSGRIFFEQVIRDNLDIGRPDHVSVIFHRRILNGRKHKTRAGSAPGSSPRASRRRCTSTTSTPRSSSTTNKGERCAPRPPSRPTRLPRIQTADQPARPAAARLHRQPAPPRRPNHQPRPGPRREGLYRSHHPARHRPGHPHPRIALRRHQGSRPAAGPAHAPAVASRIHQP